MKQVLYFLSLGLFLYSCKSKETFTPNRPPNAFTVSQTLKSDGKTIVLNWTKAKDPDGDVVTYAVVLKDSLVKNISDTTYTIASLDFNYSQAGKVIAKDAKGLTSEASFTAATKTVTFVNIPDAIFEKYLVDSKIDKDGLVNGRMNADDAKGVKKIDVSVNCSLEHFPIKSLKGIEAFIDLEELYCGIAPYPFPCAGNQIDSLNLSNNIALKIIDCSNNYLLFLDVSKNIALQTLWCHNNKLTNLDLSKNVILKDLGCGENKLTNLDLNKNIALQILWCTNNRLTNLDLNKNINLEKVYCSYNNLNTLDLSGNIVLSDLYCENNNLSFIDLSRNISLKILECSNNKLTTLNIEKNTSLNLLYCKNNEISNLDVSKNVNLRLLWCSSNQLTNLDLSKNIILKDLLCINNKIKTICLSDLRQPTSYWVKDPTATYSLCK